MNNQNGIEWNKIANILIGIIEVEISIVGIYFLIVILISLLS